MKQLRQFIFLLGKTRFVTLAVLLAICAILGGVWQKLLLPQAQALGYEKTDIENKRRKLQQDNIDMPKKIAELKVNDDRFLALQARGFTQDQDRILARSQIDALRGQTGVRGVDYKIAPQETVVPPDGMTLNGTIVHSEVAVDMKGLTDLEMRDFIGRMHDNFNGLIVAKNYEFATGEPLDEQGLLALSLKQPKDFVTAKVTFDWYAVIPKPVDPAAAQTQAFGGAR